METGRIVNGFPLEERNDSERAHRHNRRAERDDDLASVRTEQGPHLRPEPASISSQGVRAWARTASLAHAAPLLASSSHGNGSWHARTPLNQITCIAPLLLESFAPAGLPDAEC